MRLTLSSMLLPATLFACSGHVVRPSDGDRGGPAPASPPPVAAPAPAAPPPRDERPQPPEPYQGYSGGTALDLRRIGQWSHSGIDAPLRRLILDANAWAQFWSELGTGDRPEVDFDREMVIAVASGQQRTGGFAIAVEQVSRQEGELTIQVVESSPGPNCMTTTELTQPVDVVAIPRVTLRHWNFVERKAVSDCR